MRIVIIIVLILFIVSLFCCYNYLTIYKLEINKIIRKKNVDLLDEKDFNLDTMNPNRWNYGNPDFAPYIDGSYKQVTNNYIPGFTFNKNNDVQSDEKTLNDSKINMWKNKNNEITFFVQCK